MTTIQIELPHATAQAARDAGLFTTAAVERLLNDVLRRKGVNELFEKIDAVRCQREAGYAGRAVGAASAAAGWNSRR